ncbi:Uncharacterised protein [uncultured archaeon]|nr:Uncharacterised protein [uncultured archaeon]
MSATLDSRVKSFDREFNPEREYLSIGELKEFCERVSKFGKSKRDTEAAASVVGTYFKGLYGNDGWAPIFFMSYNRKRRIISKLTRYAQEKINKSE